MTIGFKPDNSIKREYNGGKPGWVKIKGFQKEEDRTKDLKNEQVKEKKIQDFLDFFGRNINDPESKQLVIAKAIKLTNVGDISAGELRARTLAKIATDAIYHFKKSPIVLFSDLTEEKKTIDNFTDLGIIGMQKEKFGELLENELLPLFVAEAKLLSANKNSQSIDMNNKQIIKGLNNLLALGIKKEVIQNAIK